MRATLGGFAAVLAVTGGDERVADRALGRHPGGDGRRRRAGRGERAALVFWRLWSCSSRGGPPGLMVVRQAAGMIAAMQGDRPRGVRHHVHRRQHRRGALGGGWMVDWLTIPTVAAGAHAVALAGNVTLTSGPAPGLGRV